jgi:hypothetical protein
MVDLRNDAVVARNSPSFPQSTSTLLSLLKQVYEIAAVVGILLRLATIYRSNLLPCWPFAHQNKTSIVVVSQVIALPLLNIE